MIIRTHNAYHLGDNLVHLHFLRKVALADPYHKFVHAAQWQYLKQLQDVVADVHNIELTDFNYTTPSDSINAWRGDNQFWYSHPDRLDFVKFHVEAWFPYLADKMNVENPIKCQTDMLFDYPAIAASLLLSHPSFDVLLINSQPGSGQFASYSAWELGNLGGQIAEKGFSVIATAQVVHRDIVCTEDANLSITQIGHLSLHCHTIVMVATGPCWPTWNVWNRDSIKLRVILSDNERVNLAPNTMHCARIEEAAEVLKKAGLL